MTRKIHQLVAGFREYDAISDSALIIQGVIRGRKYESDIFCPKSSIGVRSQSLARDFKELERDISSDDIVILHLSIGGEVNALFKRLKCRKVIIYHNITPSSFFKFVSSETAAVLEKGRKDMALLADAADINLADSSYNANELTEAGFKNARVFSLPINFSKYECGKVDPVALDKLAGNFYNILFVGRVAPNKKIENLMTVMAYLKKIVPNVRFIFAGSYSGLEAYYGLLLAYGQSLNLENFLMPGSVSQDALNTYYKNADAFLCMSEHEGFCVPLVEAMFYQIPVLSVASSAIPETLGGAGILFDDKKPNYPIIAETLAEVLRNDRLRAAIIAGQNRRIQEMQTRNVTDELFTHLASLISE